MRGCDVKLNYDTASWNASRKVQYSEVIDAEDAWERVDAAVAHLAALGGGMELNATRVSKPGSASMLGSIATVSITTELKLRSEKDKSITC